MAFPVVERRAWPRISMSESTNLAWGRVRPGWPALIINLSEGGALIETASRLLPGTSIEFQLGKSTPVWRGSGRVLRSYVSMLGSGRIRYRGALMFSEKVLIPADEGNEAAHG